MPQMPLKQQTHTTSQFSCNPSGMAWLVKPHPPSRTHFVLNTVKFYIRKRIFQNVIGMWMTKKRESHHSRRFSNGAVQITRGRSQNHFVKGSDQPSCPNDGSEWCGEVFHGDVMLTPFLLIRIFRPSAVSAAGGNSPLHTRSSSNLKHVAVLASRRSWGIQRRGL